MPWQPGRDAPLHWDELGDDNDAEWLDRQAKARATAEAMMADPSWAEPVRKDSPLEELFSVAWQREATEEALNQVEALHRPAVEAAVLAAWKTIRIDPTDPARVARALTRLQRDLASILGSAAKDGARIYASHAPEAEFRASFRLPNHYAEAWAATRAGERVSAVKAEVREAIRLETTKALAAGDAPAMLALRITRHLGLIPSHAETVDRMAAKMAEAGSRPSVVRTAANAYADRLRTLRAETVARTELLTATNWGQTQAWKERAAQGLVPQTAKRVWLIARDERTCPTCRQMTGERAFAPVNAPFSTPLGPADHPPIHPRCRCATALVTDYTTAEESAFLARP